MSASEGELRVETYAAFESPNLLADALATVTILGCQLERIPSEAITRSILRPAVLLLMGTISRPLLRAGHSLRAERTADPPSACFTMRVHGRRFAPCTPLSHQEWLNDITHWRNERRIAWAMIRRDMICPRQVAQSSFIQPQMMVHDVIFTIRWQQVYG